MEQTLANGKVLQSAATTGNGVAVDLKGEVRETRAGYCRNKTDVGA